MSRADSRHVGRPSFSSTPPTGGGLGAQALSHLRDIPQVTVAGIEAIQDVDISKHSRLVACGRDGNGAISSRRRDASAPSAAVFTLTLGTGNDFCCERGRSRLNSVVEVENRIRDLAKSSSGADHYLRRPDPIRFDDQGSSLFVTRHTENGPVSLQKLSLS